MKLASLLFKELSEWEEDTLILSRCDPIPCPYDLPIRETGYFERLVSQIPDFPFHFHRSRQVLVASRSLKPGGWDDQVFEQVFQLFQCHACMVYLPRESGHLRLSVIRALPDFAIFSTNFVHTCLAIAEEAFSSGKLLANSDHFLDPTNSLASSIQDQIIAIPICTGNRKVGVFILVTHH